MHRSRESARSRLNQVWGRPSSIIHLPMSREPSRASMMCKIAATTRPPTYAEYAVHPWFTRNRSVHLKSSRQESSPVPDSSFVKHPEQMRLEELALTKVP